MPKYKTHLAGGLVTFFILFLIMHYTRISNNNILLYLGSCLLGSLFPDIDTKSKIQKILYICLFLSIAFSVFIQEWHIAAVIGLLALIPITVNHRSITHRIWFIVFVPFFIPILVFHYNKNMLHPAFFSYLFFVGGAISHIMLDFGFIRAFRRK